MEAKIEKSYCPRCGGSGTITTSVDLTAHGLSCGSVIEACDCPAGQAWSERAAKGFHFPDWGDNPPYPWVKIS